MKKKINKNENELEELDENNIEKSEEEEDSNE